MTAVGKLLVFLNLFVAVVLVTWATSLYANRLDWLDRKTEDGEVVKGQISTLKREIEETTRLIVASQDSYGTRDRVLATLETERFYRAAQFDARLARARTGEVKGTDGPFRTIVKLGDAKAKPASPLLKLFPKQVTNGLVDVDSPGDSETTDKDKKLALRGTKEIQDELVRQLDATKTATDDILKLRTEFAAASEQIVVVGKQTDVQNEILANLLEQGKYLGSAQVNWDEELRTVLTRKRQLEARLDGLGVKLEARR